jgi:hypothetical protein
MNIHNEEQYKTAKTRLNQLSRHGHYQDAPEFETLADAIEDWENKLLSADFHENLGS